MTASPPAASHLDVLVLRMDPELDLPTYAGAGDAGLDLQARSDFTVGPGQRELVMTGVAIALPPGYVGFVSPRSGLARNHGITVLNSPGIIDASYRGEIGVIVVNTDMSAEYSGQRGDRIAQLVIIACAQARVLEVAELPGTVRSGQGFGSSGV